MTLKPTISSILSGLAVAGVLAVGAWVFKIEGVVAKIEAKQETDQRQDRSIRKFWAVERWNYEQHAEAARKLDLPMPHWPHLETIE